MGFRRSWTLGACFALLLAALLPVSADAGGLPIGKEHVDPDRLPLPFGAGLTVYSQSQEYRIADLSFDTPLLGPIDTGGIGIDNQLDEINLKLDAWIFPFLNVFGIIGDLDGTTKVGLSQLELAVPLGDLTIHYDGEVYGGGITGQSDAIALGIARYLTDLNPSYRDNLKKKGLLSRDPREKERKKYGQKRARKKFQFSKR